MGFFAIIVITFTAFMRKPFLLLFIILPLILSGCFFNFKKNPTQVPEDKYKNYESAMLNGLSFAARYQKDWQLNEQATGKYQDFKDNAVFQGKDETISVNVMDAKDKEQIVESFNVESQAQTQVDGTLGDKYAGLSDKNNPSTRFEASIMQSGDYLIIIKTTKPGSADFADFLNNFVFTKLEATQSEKSATSTTPVQKPRSDNLTISLYFLNNKTGATDCQAKAVKKVIVKNPDNDLTLIPDMMRLLIQLSQPNALPDANLYSAIPVNTRILSFGYEDNKAIVNFNSYLNQGGGSCEMQARRSQIEQTLKGLNNVSGLRIKNVEIQVEGNSQTALQP